MMGNNKKNEARHPGPGDALEAQTSKPSSWRHALFGTPTERYSALGPRPLARVCG